MYLIQKEHMNYEEEDQYYTPRRSNSTKKYLFLHHNPDEHYKSNQEAKIVRQLCAKHKMTEEELRSVKKFRKMIADALKETNQCRYRWIKADEKKARYNAKSIIAKASEETGKHIMHPETLERAKQISMDNDSNVRFWFRTNRSAVTTYISDLLKRTQPK